MCFFFPISRIFSADTCGGGDGSGSGVCVMHDVCVCVCVLIHGDPYHRESQMVRSSRLRNTCVLATFLHTVVRVYMCMCVYVQLLFIIFMLVNMLSSFR